MWFTDRRKGDWEEKKERDRDRERERERERERVQMRKRIEFLECLGGRKALRGTVPRGTRETEEWFIMTRLTEEQDL